MDDHFAALIPPWMLPSSISYFVHLLEFESASLLHSLFLSRYLMAPCFRSSALIRPKSFYLQSRIYLAVSTTAVKSRIRSGSCLAWLYSLYFSLIMSAVMVLWSVLRCWFYLISFPRIHLGQSAEAGNSSSLPWICICQGSDCLKLLVICFVHVIGRRILTF